MDNEGKIVLVIALVVLALMIIVSHSSLNLKVVQEEQNNQNNFLTTNLYDRNGQLIQDTSKSLSLVNNVPGVYFIDLTVTVANTGQQALSCTLISLSPSAYSDATQKTTKSIAVGGKTAWTSSQMATSWFDNPTTPTVFTATVLCTYNSGTQVITLPQKVGTISLDIKPEAGNAGFDVNINQGGTPTEFCGDGICQSNEDTLFCASDCSVVNFAQFRTTELSYISGSAIAFRTAGCGSNLIGYGYASSQTSSAYTCDATSGMVNKGSQCGTNPVKILSSIPGGWVGFAGSPSVWQGSDNTKICVCQNENDGVGYKFAYYTTTDADASKVDTRNVNFDTAKEVLC